MVKHFLDIESISQNDFITLLRFARGLIHQQRHKHTLPQTLQAEFMPLTLANCFFENSTRTRISFELAAKRLGMKVTNFTAQGSSTSKGESELDTLMTLAAMQCDIVVWRHRQNNLIHRLVNHLPDDIAVINAGDGNHAHPTQACLDMLTICENFAANSEFDNLQDLKVSIIGDIAHSRVARSDIAALKKLGINNIHLCGPSALKPDDEQLKSLPWHESIDSCIKDSNVIMLLRMQKERFADDFQIDLNNYRQQFALNEEKFKLAASNAIIMHPGPVNRGIEIDDACLNLDACKVLQQVEFGVAARMAIINYCRGTLS